jgi:uncharacterized protein with NRDE domain
MSTISVTVDQADNALMLVEWLKNIRFVKKVDVQIAAPSKKGNAEKIQKMLNSMQSKHLFADVSDPVAYQKQIRDEWERN